MVKASTIWYYIYNNMNKVQVFIYGFFWEIEKVLFYFIIRLCFDLSFWYAFQSKQKKHAWKNNALNFDRRYQ